MNTPKQAAQSASDSDLKFTDFGLPEILEQTLDECDLITPTPIQKMAIPALLEGKDLIGLAQTGTGKTAAFLLPLLARLSERDGVRKGQPPRALILAPTRELAMQVQENVRILTAHMNLRNISIYGGARYDGQINGLRRGVDIVIATPGRLEDLIAKKAISLEAIECFILDEADHMLDLGFYPAVTRLSALLPKERQTMLFSATMPDEIRKLCDKFLNDPVSVKAPQSEHSAKHIYQQVRLVREDHKREQLAELLASPEITSSVIFVRTKRRADQLAENLSRQGYKIDALHGDMKQFLRRKVLNKFKSGEITALIATDVAARGIDIPAISHVINFDLPDIGEAYIHRIGRTGRAGLSGTAISFCSDSETDRLKTILSIIAKTNSKIDIINQDGQPADPSEYSPGRSGGAGRSRYSKHRRDQRGGSKSGSRRMPRKPAFERGAERLSERAGEQRADDRPNRKPNRKPNTKPNRKPKDTRADGQQRRPSELRSDQDRPLRRTAKKAEAKSFSSERNSERPAQKPRKNRPASPKSAGGWTQASAEDRPRSSAKRSASKPSGKKPFGKKPFARKPAGKTPSGQRRSFSSQGGKRKRP